MGTPSTKLRFANDGGGADLTSTGVGLAKRSFGEAFPSGAWERAQAATRGASYLAWFMVRRKSGDLITRDEFPAQYVQLTDRVEPTAEHAKLYKKLLPQFEKALWRLTSLYELT